MKKNSLFLILLMISLAIFAQSNKPATDYLSVAGPMIFEAKSYQLAWSAHPNATYYKQEYLPSGETSQRFKSMLMLEVAVTDMSVKDVVAGKISELKAMKASNPIVNYEMFQKDGEYILDFLLSANAADGKTIDIIERNIYRYKLFTDKSGKKGVVLFAISTRAYGKAADNFLLNLKTTKSRYVNAIAKFSIPVISLKK